MHLNLIDRHGDLVKTSMRILEAAAKAQGIEMTITELFDEAQNAKNSVWTFGGFSPHQCVFGVEPE